MLTKSFLFTLICSCVYCFSFAQIKGTALSSKEIKRCGTMHTIEEAIKNDPGIIEKWKKEGERRLDQFKRSGQSLRGGAGTEIIIPVVFHLVDETSRLAWITDREIYDQVEILNEAYSGKKAEKYKKVIPADIYNRLGNVPVRFVLARKAPDGSLTSGIERRVNTTPGRVDVKSYSTGGLDAWDTDKYLNIWVGTFSGLDDGLLGIATFPFINTEGPQGVVIGITTIPYTSNVMRNYYPAYSEGATLAHEIGHFFYLWHTFGDSYECNNADFRIQSGWPLPNGAGSEGDDTPEEKADNIGNAHYGNPSMSYSDGCTANPSGEMYGSFMNYFDDRALFMFSKGHSKRVTGCIELYRPGLMNSDKGTAPIPVADAYLVKLSPYGKPETRTYVTNNIPLTVTVRNYGNTVLSTVKLTAKLDGTQIADDIKTVNLAVGQETEIYLGNINAAAGSHTLTIYTSNPNNTSDAFTGNDTLQSFIFINQSTINAPFAENFSNDVFPPVGWNIWNPNNNNTWTKSATSGYAAAGAATIQNYNYNGGGQLDDLVLPAIELGAADSSLLTFRIAYAVYDDKDVSIWDGLEIYLSNDNGINYQLIYKKTGNDLKTVAGKLTSAFEAPPTSPEKWGYQLINLSPYINGNKILLKFRGTNAYGNNLYLDDVSVSAVVSLNRDVKLTSITNIPTYVCGQVPTPSINFVSNGKDELTSLKINYRINDGALNQFMWTGNLFQNQTKTISLPALQALPAGAYTLTVYTSDPNGAADEFPSNDSLRTQFYVMGTTSLNVNEGFEFPIFPPDQWVLQQNGNGHSWEKTTSASSTGNASAVIKNYSYDMMGKTDNLISPVFTNQTFDSLFVIFDYAYAPGSNYPGSPGDAEDTLDVKLTMDCAQNFTSIFKSFGNQLVTVDDPQNRKNSAFIPTASDWKRVKMFVTPITGSNNFQIFFSSKGNHRNNLYIDNVQVFGINVPPLLKEKGYLLYPSPFHDQFIIRNYKEPVTLQSVQIYNSIGQLVWQQQYNGKAYKMIYVNLGNAAPGIYTVKMNYTDKTIIDRVVKQ